MRARDVALLVGVAALWGFNFVPIRWALDEVPPFALVATRFLLAAVPMVFFVRRPRAPLGWIAAYGFVIGVGQFGILFLAIRLGFPAGLASLLMQVQVFFTVAIAAFALKDRVTLPQLGGALVAGVGLALLVWEKAGAGVAGSTFTLLLVLVAALCWGVGNVVAKHIARSHDDDAFSLVVWSSLVPVLPLAAISYALEPAPLGALIGASWIAWASIVFMSAGATLFGYGVWNRMLHKHPAGAVTPFALLIPIAGLASAAIFLREPMTGLEVVAALFILAGLALALLWKLSPASSPAPPAARQDDRT